MAAKAFTIISTNYLPQAQTIADSFKKIHPEIDFNICLFGKVDEQIDLSDSADYSQHYLFIHPDNLEGNIYEELRQKYDDFSMACALKPYYSEFFFNDEEVESVLYFDADIYLFSPLTTVLNLLSDLQNPSSSIILTPHITKVDQFKDEVSKNISFLTYGTFNAGFFAIKNNQEGKKFVQWWKRMLKDFCIINYNSGLYCDQTWLNLVPILFKDNLCILQDIGYNVAYWNVDSERNLSIDSNGQYIINNTTALVFFHFARFRYFDVKNILPGLLFSDLPNNSILQDIYNDYRTHLKNNNFEKYTRDLDKAVPENIEKKQFIKISFKERVKNKLIRMIKKI
jgi:hypothetical protein